MRSSLSGRNLVVLPMDQQTISLLGRKHVPPVLIFLEGRPEGAILHDIDYSVVHSAPSAKSTMDALVKGQLVKRDARKVYHITDIGRKARAWASTDIRQVVVPSVAGPVENQSTTRRTGVGAG